MLKRIYICFALSGSLLLSSCDSFLDIQPTGKVIPNTLSEYRAILTNAYAQPFWDRGTTEIRTNELTLRDNDHDQNYYSEIEKWNDANPVTGTRQFAWSNYYTVIFYANSIINKGNEITEGSQEDIEQLVGEAYLLRGYLHFLLVNLYGQPYTKEGALESKAVPLKLDIDLESIPKRNTVSEIYAAILKDIQSARKLIHHKEWEKRYLYRFSTLSVDAMESRIRLYMGEWQNAYDASELVLSQKLTLEDFNTENVKLPNDFESTEMITAYENVCYDIEKGLRATPLLLQKYNSYDLRPAKYFDKADAQNNYPCLKIGSSQFSCTFRTGEIYLNSAEAAAHLNKLTEARNRLLQLMEKRYTPEGYILKKSEVNAMNQVDLISEILEERARELAFEGHRWFDLRRTTRPRIEKTLDGKTYILEQNDPRYTLRIPQDATDANPDLLN